MGIAAQPVAVAAQPLGVAVAQPGVVAAAVTRDALFTSTALGKALRVEGIVMCVVESLELILGLVSAVWGVGLGTSGGAVCGLVGASLLSCGCCCKGRGRGNAYLVLGIIAACISAWAASAYFQWVEWCKDNCVTYDPATGEYKSGKEEYLDFARGMGSWEVVVTLLRIAVAVQAGIAACSLKQETVFTTAMVTSPIALAAPLAMQA